MGGDSLLSGGSRIGSRLLLWHPDGAARTVNSDEEQRRDADESHHRDN